MDDLLKNVAQPVAPVVQLVTSKPSDDVGTWDFSSQKTKTKINRARATSQVETD